VHTQIARLKSHVSFLKSIKLQLTLAAFNALVYKLKNQLKIDAK